MIAGFFFYGFHIINFSHGWAMGYQAYHTVRDYCEEDIKFSIIVAARNEFENLPMLFASIENLQYPKSHFEFILVDDYSTDETVRFLKNYQTSINFKYFLKSDFEGKYPDYKKGALALGIDQSEYDHIICTDADCLPHFLWLKTVAKQYYNPHIKMVTGPVKIDPSPGLFAIFQALDFCSLNAIGAAGLTLKTPNMCNGANISYNKSLFYKLDGFNDNAKTPTGDDEYLYHKAFQQNPEQIAFVFDPNAMVTTRAETTLGSLINQRIRWVSKSGTYKFKQIDHVLIGVFLFNFCLLGMGFYALFNPNYWFEFFAFFTGKVVLDLWFMRMVTKFYGLRQYLYYLIIEQLFYIPYIVLVGFGGKFGSFKWKDRKFKLSK